MRSAIVTSALILAVLCPNVQAIHRGADDLPYAQPLSHELDKKVNEKYNGKAFFMNLGPTGIRARIDPDAPKSFKVMYVFQDAKSPARGKVFIGDHIVGANGKRFQNAHGFHRKQAGSRGWQGPPYELALAIEDSQGKDGKLALTVLRGGRGQPSKVEIQLDPVGRFAKTYPWGCTRSDKLRKRLCSFLLDEGIKGRHHYQIQQLLALMAADDKRAMKLVRSKADSLKSQRASHTQKGMCTWGWGYSGIFLGEYYHATKDKSVLQAVKALNEAYELGQDWKSGGFSHRPFPAIEQRVAGGGPKGYGSMAGPGGLSMLAQSTFKATGLPYSNRAYNRTHLSFLQTAGPRSNASIAYGFASWPATLIRLRTPNSPSKSKHGIGYRCPTGMKDIGKFEVEQWTKGGDGKWNMKLVPSGTQPWMKTEIDKLEVFATAHYVKDGSKQRQVVRPVELKEPTRPYKTTPNGGGHVAPMGMGAAAHFVGNEGNKSWNYLGQHLANACALSPGMLFDGHADATMHAFFSVVGAARADEKNLRHYLDYVKTLIILSEPHDGQGLVEQPFGCQRNATCSIARNRTAYTHVAILLLSLPKKKLLITGAGSPYNGPNVTSSSKRNGSSSSRRSNGSSSSSNRRARTLAKGKSGVLYGSLHKALLKLNGSDLMNNAKLKVSKFKPVAVVEEIDKDGTIWFSHTNGQVSEGYLLKELTAKDRAKLAIFVAKSAPDSKDAQAMAGVFLECAGVMREASKYYSEAGDESKAKFDGIFLK